MLENTVLIWVVTSLYLLQTVILTNNGDYGHAVMFLGYALANIGVVWAVMDKVS